MSRFLRRIEQLLRLGLDPGAAPNEKRVALERALEIVVATRVGTSAEWRETPSPMQQLECEECDDPIRPIEKKFTNGSEYRHIRCHDAVLSAQATPSTPA